jgi:hypothetical protein
MKRLLLLSLILFSFSCSKEKNDSPKPIVPPKPTVFIDSPTIDLKYNTSHQFVVTKGIEVLDPWTLKWSSSDTLVGIINKYGQFISRKIGTTIIKGTLDGDTVESKITVSPYITSFKEPYLGFGADIATIKTNETRKFITQLNNSLSFEGDNSKIRSVLYFLDANSKMTSAGLFFEHSSTMIYDVTTFLRERYPNYGPKDYLTVFHDDNNTIEIQITISADLGFHAIYLPFVRTGKTSSNINDTYKQFEKALK